MYLDFIGANNDEQDCRCISEAFHQVFITMSGFCTILGDMETQLMAEYKNIHLHLSTKIVAPAPW